MKTLKSKHQHFSNHSISTLNSLKITKISLNLVGGRDGI